MNIPKFSQHFFEIILMDERIKRYRFGIKFFCAKVMKLTGVKHWIPAQQIAG